MAHRLRVDLSWLSLGVGRRGLALKRSRLDKKLYDARLSEHMCVRFVP